MQLIVRFSQRKKLTLVKVELQREALDDELRIGLWNALSLSFWDHVVGNDLNDRVGHNLLVKRLCRELWLHFFKEPVDTLSWYWPDVHKRLRSHFFQAEWFEVYDFIEFVAQTEHERSAGNASAFVANCNYMLEREVSAYRFLNLEIVEITSPEEIKAIEDGLVIEVPPVRQHLERSLQLLSDRKTPDYRNAIKEAISAVESACKTINGSEKGDLHAALDKIAEKVELHPALRLALTKLYAYTSDEKGIRHALMKNAGLQSFEDAKFMLVACAAFCSYLFAKAARPGIQ